MSKDITNCPHGIGLIGGRCPKCQAEADFSDLNELSNNLKPFNYRLEYYDFDKGTSSFARYRNIYYKDNSIVFFRLGFDNWAEKLQREFISIGEQNLKNKLKDLLGI